MRVDTLIQFLGELPPGAEIDVDDSIEMNLEWRGVCKCLLSPWGDSLSALMCQARASLDIELGRAECREHDTSQGICELCGHSRHCEGGASTITTLELQTRDGSPLNKGEKAVRDTLLSRLISRRGTE